MTGLLGMFGSDEPAPPEPCVRQMLEGMRMRGADAVGLWRDESATLAVSRFTWERSAGFSDSALVVAEGDVAVVCDASLYYVGDLEGRLAAAGERATERTPSHLILAAYRAWGDGCVERLEGDFAFIIWDRKAHRAFASRDYGGTRSLYYAEIGRTLVIASTIGGVLAHPACPADLNLTVVAESASGFFAASHETCYRAIQRLDAGHSLGWSVAQPSAQVRRWWNAPVFESEGEARVPFDRAAEELRALICRATEERLAPSGVTCVSMSGGWDSPSVFAAGQEALRRSGDRSRTLEPVSVSFPVGDSGREDETIQAIADHWQSPVHWIDIETVPMFDRAAARAAARDEPFAHPYEMFNRALGRESAAAGSRVCLSGMAGDPLFQASPVFVADVLRSGRPVQAIREWRAVGGEGGRDLFRWAVQPLLPPMLLKAASMVRRGRRLRGHLEKILPPWMDPRFVADHGLEERETRHTPARVREAAASYEARWSLVHPFFSRIYGVVFDLHREEGVELRSPLYDERVVRYAAGRPRVERVSGGQTKRLLREAMRGLLPAHTLAPRQFRTGTMTTYFTRSVWSGFADVIEPAFENSALEALGIVDGAVLRREGKRCARDLQGQDGGWLMFTLLTELWLRTHIAVTGDEISATASNVGRREGAATS